MVSTRSILLMKSIDENKMFYKLNECPFRKSYNKINIPVRLGQYSCLRTSRRA